VAFSPQKNLTDWATAAGRRIVVPTFTDRVVSRVQRDGSPQPLISGFLDRSRYFFLSRSSSYVKTEWTPIHTDPTQKIW
jgi:hypothetical protein